MAHNRKSKGRQAAINRARANAPAIKAQYDAVAANAGRKRRKAKVELEGETGKNSRQLPPMKRLMVIGLVRDSIRNFSSARSMIRQIALNVVGTEYKVIIKHPDVKDLDLRKEKDNPVFKAQSWFNDIWAKHPDFRNDNHLFDVNRLLLSSVVTDGDVGMLFDRDFQQTGKIVTFESDQICDPKPLPQGVTSSNDGILLDQFGREIGYFTHFERGKTNVKLADGHVFPRDIDDADNNMFKLLRMPWRPNQGRGTSDMFSFVSDLLDVYEMRSKELQSAKLTASWGAAIEQALPEDGPAVTDPRYDPNVPEDEAEDEEKTAVKSDDNYERLEALTGGYLDYLKKGDKLIPFENHRPNLDGIPFSEFVIKNAGSAMGMARCYSTMQAQTSYTAFRGEMIMTWVMFRYWQKWIERYVQDWQAIRAIRFAIAIGELDPLPEGWENCLAWQHPKMPSLNPLLDQKTFLAALKNGSTNLEKEIGPGWKGIIEELISELDHLRDNNVPHAIFETVAGAVAGTQKEGN